MNSIFKTRERRLTFDVTKILRSLAIVYALAFALIVFLNDFKETQHWFFIIATVRYLDKLGHLLVMGLFSFVVNLALNGRSTKISRFKYLTGSIAVFVVATLEETSQIFVSGRDFEFSDVFFNTLGILLFGEIARLTIKIAEKISDSLNQSAQTQSVADLKE